MSRTGHFQNKVAKIREEMEKGTGRGPVIRLPIALEPEYSKFSYATKPKSWLQNILEKEKPQKRFNYTIATVIDNYSFICIRPSRDEQLNLLKFEQLLCSFRFDYPIGFEVIGCANKVELQFVIKKDDVSRVINIVQAQFFQAEIFEQEDGLKRAFPHTINIVGYKLGSSHFFPLATPNKLDSLSILLSHLNSLQGNEAGALQVLFQPVKHNWQENILKASRNELDPIHSVFADIPELVKLSILKTSKLLFAVSLRIIATSPNLITRLESFFQPFSNQYNYFSRIKEEYPQRAALNRTVHASGMLLNAEELTGLIHLPDSDISIQKLKKARRASRLSEIAKDESGIHLGYNRYQGKNHPVYISHEQLTRHIAVFGGTGAGKTNLLSHLFKNLIDDFGVFFIDPNGDAALEFLEIIGKRHIDRVVYFDPIKHPLSINPLYIKHPSQIELTTVNMLTALKRLFDESSWGVRLEWILRKSLKTLILSGNKTLSDIPPLLTDKSYRHQVLSGINDPELLSFWEHSFNKLPSNALVSIFNKLSLLLDSDIIKPIISKPQPDIDFDDVLNKQQIFIVNLSKGTLGNNATVLGSLFLSSIQLATMARARIPKEQRKPFALIVDEFSNYSDSSNVSSINSLLSEARKYKVSLITACQFLSQMDRRIREAIFGNVGTIMALRVGLDDSNYLQKELGQFSSEDILNLRVGEAIVRMGTSKDSFNLQIPLLEKPENDYTQKILNKQKSKQAEKASKETKSQKPVVKATDVIHLPYGEAAQNQPSNNLKSEENNLLAFLYQNNEPIPFTKLAKELNISSRQLYKLASDLSKQGLLAETKLRLASGAGRTAKVVFLTSEGITTLGYTHKGGKGGAVHQYFQRIIKTYAQKIGYKATVEKHIGNQQTVDISLEKENKRIAIEISCSTKATDEMKNINKCIAANYDKILVFCSKETTASNLEKLVDSNFQPIEKDKIFISPMRNLFQDLFRSI